VEEEGDAKFEKQYNKQRDSKVLHPSRLLAALLAA
jgi:hypothetical protein